MNMVKWFSFVVLSVFSLSATSRFCIPLDSPELISHDRFTSIKTSTEKARDEINFWSIQMSEHALLLHLGLEDPVLKQRGLELHEKWEKFIANLPTEPFSNVLPLLEELRAYKLKVVQTLQSGLWIGLIFPSFARHITRELDYFVDKLNDVLFSDKEEVKFWDKINSDHAGFSSHLLDITERELSLEADYLSQKIKRIVRSEREMFIKISLKAAKELDEFNRSAQRCILRNKIASIIHPVLIAHVIREGERSIQTLSRLELNQKR